MSQSTVDVVIVDDDALVLTGLRLMLRSAPEIRIVGELSDGSKVVPYLYERRADTVLLDVRMPEVNGISAARAIKSRFPDTRVVLMSTMPTEAVEGHAANVGADAFVNKTSPAMDFRRAIAGARPETVGRRDHAQTTKTLENLLSDREFEVALLVANGLRNEDIARQGNLSINTVKTYVSRTLTKLGMANRVQLANYVNERYRPNEHH